MADISKALDTAIPAGTASPTDLDTFIKDTKEGFRERLNVDHGFAFSSGTTVETAEATAGKHKKVTFSATAAPGTPTAPNAYLYTSGDPEELYFINDSASAVQITSGAALATPAVDDATIEYAGGLKVILPDAGTDADQTGDKAVLPCVMTGSYIGNGVTGQFIELGAKLLWMTIKKQSASEPSVKIINDDTYETVWGDGEGGTLLTGITIDDNTGTDDRVNLTDGDAKYNGNGATYTWFAICERA